MIRRYYHGPVAIHADPDFEEAADGDVVLWTDHEAECAALRAEVERLRGRQRELTQERDHWEQEATELLRRARRVVRGENLEQAIGDFLLAAQPAAPARTEFCAACMSPNGFCQCVGSRTGDHAASESCQPAAPDTDHEGRPMTYWGGQPAAPARAEIDARSVCGVVRQFLDDTSKHTSWLVEALRREGLCVAPARTEQSDQDAAFPGMPPAGWSP